MKNNIEFLLEDNFDASKIDLKFIDEINNNDFHLYFLSNLMNDLDDVSINKALRNIFNIIIEHNDKINETPKQLHRLSNMITTDGILYEEVLRFHLSLLKGEELIDYMKDLFSLINLKNELINISNKKFDVKSSITKITSDVIRESDNDVKINTYKNILFYFFNNGNNENFINSYIDDINNFGFENILETFESFLKYVSMYEEYNNQKKIEIFCNKIDLSRVNFYFYKRDKNFLFNENNSNCNVFDSKINLYGELIKKYVDYKKIDNDLIWNQMMFMSSMSAYAMIDSENYIDFLLSLDLNLNYLNNAGNKNILNLEGLMFLPLLNNTNKPIDVDLTIEENKIKEIYGILKYHNLNLYHLLNLLHNINFNGKEEYVNIIKTNFTKEINDLLKNSIENNDLNTINILDSYLSNNNTSYTKSKINKRF